MRKGKKKPILEKDLIFKPIRKFSPQWEVFLRKKLIARVTERVIQKPRYVVSWYEQSLSCEQKCRSRAEVVKVLLRIAGETK